MRKYRIIKTITAKNNTYYSVRSKITGWRGWLEVWEFDCLFDTILEAEAWIAKDKVLRHETKKIIKEI